MSLRRLSILVLSLVAVLAASACGGGAADGPEDPRLLAAAATQAELDLTGELATTEMVDVRTGEARTLGEVVPGDRAVLLWYWAPD